MIIAYVLTTLVINLFLFVVWNTNTLLNTFLRVTFGLMTMWSFVVLLQQLAPYINNGAMRLV